MNHKTKLKRPHLWRPSGDGCMTLDDANGRYVHMSEWDKLAREVRFCMAKLRRAAEHIAELERRPGWNGKT
ncbi:hypothetical protein J2801_003634 [Paraburkholderia phenoliruptrix]|uniref:hypothetical protein n=1 Tax=Paraburkholderia phenoliruptrix TaxID=252970 RepID=UPI00286030A9|nr:hypothetical protein [Paraburkholderia phenoliruptrix]MDR6421346.1 hypothetical protein [Paraburkholderia phenoliruptrix]